MSDVLCKKRLEDGTGDRRRKRPENEVRSEKLEVRRKLSDAGCQMTDENNGLEAEDRRKSSRWEVRRYGWQ